MLNYTDNQVNHAIKFRVSFDDLVFGWRGHVVKVVLITEQSC